MLFPVINQQISTLSLSKSELALRSGLSRPTVRLILQGRGTVTSLSSMLPVLGLKWNGADDAGRQGAALSDRRRTLGLTQAQVAGALNVSRPVIIGLERDLRGEVATLCAYAKLLNLRDLIVPITAKRRLVPKTNNSDADRVMTPPSLAQALCAHFSPHLSGRILDPARGVGAFYDAFPKELERDWCEIDDGRDFYAWSEPVDWIITNPPWSRLAEFLQHAMSLAENIVFIAPLPNLSTKARLRMMSEAGFGFVELVLIDTPKTWPQSGFQIVAAWIGRDTPQECRIRRLEL